LASFRSSYYMQWESAKATLVESLVS
jgi:hypothetical protein